MPFLKGGVHSQVAKKLNNDTQVVAALPTFSPPGNRPLIAPKSKTILPASVDYDPDLAQLHWNRSKEKQFVREFALKGGKLGGGGKRFFSTERDPELAKMKRFIPQDTKGIAGRERLLRDIEIEGYNVINCGMGNPSHPILPCVNEVSIFESVSMRDISQSKYGSPYGLLKLRDAVAKYANRNYASSQFTSDNVLMTTGGSGAFSGAVQLVVGDGDEVLLFPPAYTNYIPVIKKYGGVPVFANTNARNNFKPTAEEIKRCFEKSNGKIKMVLFNYPNNPTGAILSEAEAREIGECLNEMAQKYWGVGGFTILLDDVFSEVVFGAKSHSIFPYLSPKLQKNTLIINSASKRVGASADRIGDVVAHPQIICGIERMITDDVLGPNVISQKKYLAYLEYLEKSGDKDVALEKHYAPKVQYMAGELNALAKSLGWKKLPVQFMPKGGIFVFADLSGLIGCKFPEAIQKHVGGKTYIENDVDIADLLLNMGRLRGDKCGVSVTPGSGFGVKTEGGFVRVCISGLDVPMERDIDLKRVADIIKHAAHLCMGKEYTPDCKLYTPENTLSHIRKMTDAETVHIMGGFIRNAKA